VASLSPSSHAPLRIDLGNKCLWRGARTIPLRPKTFSLLCCLAQRPGQLVTLAELGRAVWPNIAVGDGSLAVCIHDLRCALEDDSRSPRFIETVHRRGYRLVGHIAVSAAADTPLPETTGRSRTGRLARPPAGARHTAGRAVELEQLGRWLAASLGGARQVVFVTGEAGSGKTTLLDAFIQTARAQDDLLVACGECVEQYGFGEAYLPVLEAVARVCRGPGGQEIAARLAQRAPTWLVHMPWLAGLSGPETPRRPPPGATRERMLREMAEALEALAAYRPVLLVLEDLHWSDRSTLDLLACLARRREPARLLVIGTYRPTEVTGTASAVNAIRQDLHARGQCAELPLPFLSEVVVREYLSARLPAGAMVPGLSRLLHQRTDGNPLFLVNLVEYWLAEGWIVAEGGRLALGASLDELAVGVPENLWQMIECWIGRLDPGQQRVLEVSSVAGTEFSAAVVAAGLGQEVAEVDECCAKLARQAQWLAATGETLWPDGTIAGGYRFVHALYQEALYRRVSPARRVRLHRLIGERQETAYGDRVSEIAAPLAVHFERGREYRKAIGYLRRAADVAVRRCANNEAVDYLSKGLALVDTLGSAPDRTRLELEFLTAAGPALTALKGYGAPEVERAYVRAAALCDRLKNEARLTAVLRGLVALRQQRGELRPALPLARRLLGLARRAQDASRLLQAHQAAGTTLFYLGELRRARQRLASGLAIYGRGERGTGAVRSGLSTAVVCLGHTAWALWLLGYPDQALAKSQQALALAERLSHPHGIVYALHFSCVVHQFRGEIGPARERAEAVVTLATEHGFAFWMAYGAIMQGWALAAQGRYDEGLGLMRHHLVSLQATGSELGRTYFLALLGDACAKARRIEGGLRAVAEGLGPIADTGERFYEAELYRLRGEMLRRRPPTGGRKAAAAAEDSLRRALQVARHQQARSLELRAAMSLSRRWCRRGKPDAARRLVSRVYGWFTEGFATEDLKAARRLLVR
jgi:DNA-binding winged helix-turn-helix (wHTH) protein/predicted ATPase